MKDNSLAFAEYAKYSLASITGRYGIAVGNGWQHTTQIAYSWNHDRMRMQVASGLPYAYTE